jgi:hypothetical protein
MKNISTFLILGGIIAGLVTCKKEKDCEMLYESGSLIGVITPKNEQFEVNIKTFHNDDSEISIIRQSKHFSVSEIKKVNTELIYRYKPSPDFTGFDSVFFQSRNCNTRTVTNSSIKISVIN